MQQADFFGGAAPSGCNISQAVSALIKSLRLRRTQDAVYWYTHILKYWPEQQYRAVRRVLIMAAEDGINVPVQQAVADWFKQAVNSKDMKFVYRGGVSMIHLICATPNWWSDPAGSFYICMWRRTARWFKEDIDDAQKEDIAKRPTFLDDPVQAFRQHMCRMNTDGFDRGKYAEELAEEARKRGNLYARLTALVAARYAKPLAGDDNYTGQALYRLVYGPLGGTEYPKIDPNAVAKSEDLAKLALPQKVPSWALDGIHVGGKDRRFAGDVPQMLGCCNAYRHFKRLDPADEWFGELYSTTRLLESLKAEGINFPADMVA